MRYVFGVLALLMFLAVVLQYNDPDGPLWMVYYGVPAIWCALAALRPSIFMRAQVRALLAASVVAAVVLTIWYWPPVAGFWHEQVWEMGKTDVPAAAIAEQAREGMGMMIATVVVVAVAFWAFLRPTRIARGGRLTA